MIVITVINKIGELCSKYWKHCLLLLLIIGLVRTCGACASSGSATEFLNDFNRSPLEKSKNDTIAAYALCARLAGEKGVTAGMNVQFCQPWQDRALDYDKFRICETVKPRATCYNEIFEK